LKVVSIFLCLILFQHVSSEATSQPVTVSVSESQGVSAQYSLRHTRILQPVTEEETLHQIMNDNVNSTRIRNSTRGLPQYAFSRAKRETTYVYAKLDFGLTHIYIDNMYQSIHKLLMNPHKLSTHQQCT
jgi:hypothetical protein